MRDCREQTGAKAGFFVLVTSRAHDEIFQVKRRYVQLDVSSHISTATWKPLRWPTVTSSAGQTVPLLKTKQITIQKNPCDYKGHTHTHASPRGGVQLR